MNTFEILDRTDNSVTPAAIPTRDQATQWAQDRVAQQAQDRALQQAADAVRLRELRLQEALAKIKERLAQHYAPGKKLSFKLNQMGLSEQQLIQLIETCRQAGWTVTVEKCDDALIVE